LWTRFDFQARSEIAVDSKPSKTATKRAGKHEANLVLETHLKELGLGFVTEYRICDWRKWRADYALYVLAYMERRVLIEIEGGTWTRNSRHTRGSGYEKDLEKYNTCAAMGYKLFRFSTGQVLTGKAKEFLKEWLVLPAESKT
jgi:hypothetical protein